MRINVAVGNNGQMSLLRVELSFRYPFRSNFGIFAGPLTLGTRFRFLTETLCQAHYYTPGAGSLDRAAKLFSPGKTIEA